MARLRGWLLRAIILTVLLSGAAGAWTLTHRASPEAVKAALVAALETQFPDVEVFVGGAKLRLFGGVSVTDLRLTRKGDSAPFFAAPTAVIYHDKQTLHTGRIQIRKLELDGPTFRLVRRADGTWNVPKPTPSGPPDAVMPTVVLRGATVFVTDEQPNGLPPIMATDVRFSLVNDPAPMLALEVQATIAPVGTDGQPPAFAVAVGVTAKYHRPSGHTTAKIEVPSLAFIPELAPGLARVNPALADYAGQFSGHLGITAEVATQPDPARPVKYDVRVEVREGRFEDAKLPWPLERIAAAVRFQDGKLTVERGRASFGKATLDLTLETKNLIGRSEPSAPPTDELAAIQEQLERLDLTVRDLVLDDDLFTRLPPKAARVRTMLQPTGALDVSARFSRAGAGWKRELEIRPNRLGIVYEKFPYPLQHLAGRIVKVVAHDGTNEIRVELTGSAGGRRIEASGLISEGTTDPMIRMRIAGTDLPIDESLINAFPAKTARAVRKLRASGRGDFVADFHQERDVNRCENTFQVTVYGGSVKYDYFPYPLTDVRGEVIVRSVAVDETRPERPGMPLTPPVDNDRVEMKNFTGRHEKGLIWLSGNNRPVPGTPDRKLALRVQGLDCPLDEDLYAAASAVKLDAVCRTFRPRGRMTFGMDVEIFDRNGSLIEPPPPVAVVQAGGAEAVEPPFDPVNDLKMVVNFKGPSITPDFFSYQMDELAGIIHYQGGKLDGSHFRARHGRSAWALDAAEVRFPASGEVWANVGRLTASPLVPDTAFAEALPPKLRSGLNDLKPTGPIDLLVHQLVVQVPPEPAAGPAAGDNTLVYWNAELRLAGAGLEIGAPWTDLHGVIGSTGRYERDHLGAVVGNVWLDKGTVAKQPLTSAKLAYRVRPQEPEPMKAGTFTPPILEVPDLAGVLYQGAVGGEARVVLGDPVRYRVWLTAADVRLDQLAANCQLSSGAELKGMAQGQLVLENAPDPRTGELVVTGAGQVDVPSGRMYNLPVLLPLLKLLKLQTPDQTAFEEAHATFTLRGDRVSVSQLDLIGTAVSLGGSGEMDTSGEDVRFEFYTIWSQAIKRWLTGPNGTDVTAILSGNLFKIEMVKKNGAMQYKPHVMPVVTDPVRAVAERLRNRLGRSEPGSAPATVRATIQR